jgi:quinol monooxygenase YgiN
MSGPFIYVGTFNIKPGRLEEASKDLKEHADLIEANEPRLIAFNVYLDELGSKVSVVQVHPDAASMDFHMKVIAEHLKQGFDYLDGAAGIEMYGQPPDGLVESEREWIDLNKIRLMPARLAGFTRANVR